MRIKPQACDQPVPQAGRGGGYAPPCHQEDEHASRTRARSLAPARRLRPGNLRVARMEPPQLLEPAFRKLARVLVVRPHARVVAPRQIQHAARPEEIEDVGQGGLVPRGAAGLWRPRFWLAEGHRRRVRDPGDGGFLERKYGQYRYSWPGAHRCARVHTLCTRSVRNGHEP